MEHRDEREGDGCTTAARVRETTQLATPCCIPLGPATSSAMVSSYRDALFQGPRVKPESSGEMNRSNGVRAASVPLSSSDWSQDSPGEHMPSSFPAYEPAALTAGLLGRGRPVICSRMLIAPHWSQENQARCPVC